jgi:hypothetical protein
MAPKEEKAPKDERAPVEPREVVDDMCKGPFYCRKCRHRSYHMIYECHKGDHNRYERYHSLNHKLAHALKICEDCMDTEFEADKNSICLSCRENDSKRVQGTVLCASCFRMQKDKAIAEMTKSFTALDED